MANFVRLRPRCLLFVFPLFTILSLTRSASAVDGAKRVESFVIDDHPIMQYVLQEVQDLKSTIIDLGEKLNAQEEKLISLLRSASPTGAKVDNSASVCSIPDQMINALERRISDKLKGTIEANEKSLEAKINAFNEKLRAEMRKSQLTAVLQNSKTQSNESTSQASELEELTLSDGDGGGSRSDVAYNHLYIRLSTELQGKLTKTAEGVVQERLNKTVEGIVQEKLKSFNRSMIRTVDEKANHLLGKINTIERRRLTSNPAGRTCQELMNSDPTLGSGFYYIDPDGLRMGDPPIRVRCEKSGETIVVHDTMERTNVKQCTEAGCYSRNVTYSNATMRQIKALIQLSSNCSQHIRYDCFTAPLRFYGVDYAWWNDRHGEAQYYWTGNSITKNAHTCSCGLTGKCIDTNAKCNCDASVGSASFDDGTITNKDHLPITRLNFGRLLSSSSKAEHTLGPLRCSGTYHRNDKNTITSCADLWHLGQLHTGFYQAQQGNGTVIVTLHCDMSKLPGDTGFETLIGHVDAKPPEFNVQYLSRVPSSCADLRRAGQSASGLYQVQTDDDDKRISTVFCDMSKRIGDKHLETLLGYSDVKPSSYIEHSSKVPSSCADLRRAGLSTSGLYQVQTNNTDGQRISSVFCDMSKPIGDKGLEKLVGYIDAKPRDFTQHSSKVPTSCADLRRAGQSTSGLYQVQTNNAQHHGISTVFCDMSEPIESKGFETFVGINDVKSSLVHFSVARISPLNVTAVKVIPYEHVILNLGNAMNITSGVFTAPKAGIYSFTFNFMGQADFGWARIRLNGENLIGSKVTVEPLVGSSAATAHVKIRLKAGDQVDTYVPGKLRLFSDFPDKSVNLSGSLLVEL